ncbi:MAG TPA: HAD family hydrolase [Kofleriaceae bacterium]|nr:HAD family hydrolase [Kofleriaceae bacterium]
MILYLFDIDGTLLHARRSGRRVFDAVFAARHGVERACEGIAFGGKTDPALVDEIFIARLGRPATDDERAAFLDAYLPLLRADLAQGGVEVLGGVAEVLAWLAEQPSVLLGIATGNVRAGAEAKLSAAGLGSYFALGGYGCDSRVRAELVATAIARGREHGELREVVVVGDTVHDISAARACGAVACAVATGSDPAEALGHADVVLASMAELPAWHAARFG